MRKTLLYTLFIYFRYIYFRYLKKIDNTVLIKPKPFKNINIRNIEKNIAKLKQKNILKRIGSNKKGYWKVIKNFK